MHVLVQMAKDIVSGMEHLRANDVVHRDLAARNLLLEIRSNGEHRVKVQLRSSCSALPSLWPHRVSFFRSFARRA
jgi:serine/threonine protein kinase